MFCDTSWNPIYLIFTNEAPQLLYYSHIPTMVISLIIGFFVYKNSKSLVSKILLTIAVLFTMWSMFNLFIWVSDLSNIMSFIWSFFGILTALLFLSSIYFTHVYITQKDVSIWIKSIWLVLLLPLIVFIKYAAPEFNLASCEVVENSYYTYYYYLIGLISFIWIISFAVFSFFKTKEVSERKQITYLTIGISAFLIFFSISGFFAVYVGNFELEQYGFFGMVIFMAYLAFLIVRFKAFDIKLIGAQTLVWAMIIMVGTQFLFIRTNINRVLTSVTLVVSAIVGLLIVRSIKREISQRQYIEILAQSLETSNQKLVDVNGRLENSNMSLKIANDKLKELDSMKSEFVSLATHQIRGPLAAIKGYISLMVEGDYGKVPKYFNEPLNTIFMSTDSLSNMVTDFLDVSRIDLGQMKYEFTKFDFCELVEEVAKELKPNIDARGLDFRVKLTKDTCIINADRLKLKQVMDNLIDNSSKYTKTGWIEVSLEKIDANKVLFAIKDSGVGIPPTTISKLFQRFSRSENANDTNIIGTGLGLYIAKKMVEANHGKIWAESEGEGRGSQFYVELPLV